MQTIQFANPMLTAQSIAKILNSKHKRFSPRPYNYRMPEDTTWWLVPSTDWPAYKYGKYVFWKEGSVMWCGFNVEKGLGHIAAKAFLSNIRADRMTVNDGWMWNAFERDMRDGEVSRVILEIKEYINQPVYIQINSSFVQDPNDYDPNAPKSDSIEFIFDKGTFELSNRNLPQNTLPYVLQAKQVNNVPDLMYRSNDIDWIWIDIYVIVCFKLPYSEGSDSNALDGYQVFEKVLRPMEKWVM